MKRIPDDARFRDPERDASYWLAMKYPKGAEGQGAAIKRIREIDWGGVATWVFGFALIAYLGLDGGGFDPIVHDQVGIAIWWIVIAGVLVGALPRRRLGSLAWVTLGLFAAFVLWTALSLSWTESTEKTFADLARVAGYLGIFALALLIRGIDGARRLASAVAAGIVLVAAIALLSRLHPSWFPAADQTAQFLTGNRERLSYPINYWNGLAALVAIGYPLVLHFAAAARSLAFRALAAAAFPAMMLTSYFTFSRAGIGAAAIAVGVFILLTSDRIPKLATLLVAGGGGALLCLAADARGTLADGLINSTSESQGDTMLLLTLVVCAVVGAIQVGISIYGDEDRRPQWSTVTRNRSLTTMGIAGAVLVVALVVINAPGRAADAWDEFKEADSPGKGSGRLISAAGQNRYEYWLAAVDENETKPLTGTGSGTFEFWWARNRDSADAIRDTHSLYFQTFGELGIVGLLILLAFIAVVLRGGGREIMRAHTRRPLLAAAFAGCVAFLITAVFDWMWQIPVLAAALLLLAAILVTAVSPPPREEPAPFGWPARGGAAAVAVVAIVAIAIPLTASGLLRESEADAREGDLIGALEAARSAQNTEPGAATPRLQQALILEELGDFDGAAEAAREATERGKTNWRTWLILARIEAQRGRAVDAVAAYRRARALNPHHPIFDQ
jgi:O-Antigen ligase/Tetratricopeptide repeat